MTKITRNNTAVVLIDHQVGLLTGVRDMTTQDLEHNVVHLAKAAKLLGIPVVSRTPPRTSGDRQSRRWSTRSAIRIF